MISSKPKWRNTTLFNIGLLAYLYLVLLPGNNTSLCGLVDRSPDLGILVILVTVLAVGWVAASAVILLKARVKGEIR